MGTERRKYIFIMIGFLIGVAYLIIIGFAHAAYENDKEKNEGKNGTLIIIATLILMGIGIVLGTAAE